MKYARNPHKAIEAIERLVGGCFGMDMECLQYNEPDADPRLLEAAKLIGKIYMIAHAEGSCEGGHDSWRKIKYDILAKDPDTF